MECKHKERHKVLNLLDTSGALASTVCAVHCIATPVFLVLAPALGAMFTHQIIHIAMFALVLPLALLTLGFSTWRSKNWSLLILGICGCCLLALGIELEHEFSPGWFSPATWSNIFGGALLASAHILNLRSRDSHQYC